MGKKLYLESTAVVPDKQRMPSPVNPIVGTLKLWMSTRSDFDDKLAARKVSVKSATRRVLAATKDRRAWADHARDALNVETDPRYMRGAGRRDSTPASRSASAAPSEASLAAAGAAAAEDGSGGVGGVSSGTADGANDTADSDRDGGGDVAASSAKVDAAAAAAAAPAAAEAAATGGEPLSAPAGGGGVGLAHTGDSEGGDVAAVQGDSSSGSGGRGDGDDAAAKGDPRVGAAASASDAEQAAHSQALDLALGIDRAAYWPRYDSVDLDSEPDAISGHGGVRRLLRSASSAAAAAAAAGAGNVGNRRPAAIGSSLTPRRGVAATATLPRAGAEKSKRPAVAGGAVGGGLRRHGARRKLWHPPPPSLGAIKRKKLWCPMCCGMCASAHAVEAAMHMLSLRGGGGSGGDASRRRPLPKLSLYSLQSGTTAFA